MELVDLAVLAQSCREGEKRFDGFLASDAVRSLGWPDDVVEQWLYDFADDQNFQRDYCGLNLSAVKWGVEVIPVEEFEDMPTGRSDIGCLEDYAANPDYWVSVRRHGAHKDVAWCWETHGTWKRWPILIDRRLLDPPANGLQVVEGRTRVGVLRGRHREEAFVADRHLAWVGRASS